MADSDTAAAHSCPVVHNDQMIHHHHRTEGTARIAGMGRCENTAARQNRIVGIQNKMTEPHRCRLTLGHRTAERNTAALVGFVFRKDRIIHAGIIGSIHPHAAATAVLCNVAVEKTVFNNGFRLAHIIDKD